MQERIYELEKVYEGYLRKLRLKRVLGLFVEIFALWGVFFSWGKWQEKKVPSSKINAEKRLLEDKISQARTTWEKQKVNHQKLEREKELLREELELLQNLVRKFVISSNALNLTDLKESSYQNPSIKKALKLTELYLEHKDYKKSIFWSLRANEMDASSKQSSLLFAKAKEALGEVAEAKGVPELYEVRWWNF